MIYVHLNSISVIYGQLKDDNEEQCGMKPCLWFKILLPTAILKPDQLDQLGQQASTC